MYEILTDARAVGPLLEFCMYTPREAARPGGNLNHVGISSLPLPLEKTCIRPKDVSPV